ncbi:hypothetical protein B0H63DRAFT_184127 [Podospora didyma]|uniref:Uncharacterized protein n=1 Tax=Podospora didyma TaxID=330526 RepID=A0AAE0NPZ3_9PEZI|nr:hypothetical protein B0H63DRAFT_184127 [Podospora didyma]
MLLVRGRAILPRELAVESPVARDESGAPGQLMWKVPDGKLPDFSQKFVRGDDIMISWNKVNNSVYDLWFTTCEDAGADTVMAVNLARNINLSTAGTLRFASSRTTKEQLAKTNKFMLRFKPPTEQGFFVASDPELASPGFLVVSQQDPDSNTIPLPNESSPIGVFGTGENPPTTSASSPGLSSGAAAGLAIGLILLVFMVVAAEFAFLWWRRRRKDTTVDVNILQKINWGGMLRYDIKPRALFSNMRLPNLNLKRNGRGETGVTSFMSRSRHEWHQIYELQGDGSGGGEGWRRSAGPPAGFERRPSQVPRRKLTINSVAAELEG